MTDLNELTRLLREAREAREDRPTAGFPLDEEQRLDEALRNAAEELIRDARRYRVIEHQLMVANEKFRRAVNVLTGIHSMCYPPRVTTPDGKVMEFRSPIVHEQMQELSDRIRAIPHELAAIDAAIAQEQP